MARLFAPSLTAIRCAPQTGFADMALFEIGDRCFTPFHLDPLEVRYQEELERILRGYELGDWAREFVNLTGPGGGNGSEIPGHEGVSGI